MILFFFSKKIPLHAMKKMPLSKNNKNNNNGRRKSREPQEESQAESSTKPRGSRVERESNVPEGMLNFAINHCK